ncbi:sensor domain-containing protein [Metabacillus halosaccharovorans]|uniref:sensor domain-containing protein n=1 Tax=Metabacillus halosaccharovorans TaxID=930124 RepID=UPI0009955E8C|nr:EAL domain-containing protein [Metabacillus halosaccharovorans]
MFLLKIKWLLISIFVLVEIFVLVADFFLPIKHIAFSILHITISFVTVVFILILSYVMNKTTKELKHSNERLRYIFDSLDVAIWSHDMKKDHLMITPGIEKLYGHSLEEFYRDQLLWRKVVLPEDQKVIEERLQLLTKKEPVTSFYRIVRPDGKVRWIRDRGIPAYDEKGDFVDFTSVLFDVTEQMEREERYRGLVEMSPDIIAVIRDWKFVFINKAGNELFGTSDIIGRHVLEFVSTENVRSIKDIVQEMDDNDNNIEKNYFECQLLLSNGDVIDAEVSLMKILYEGRIAKLVVGRDITERKKAQQLIHNMAYYDSVTNLPNRNMFKEHLINSLTTNGENQELAVLFLDLDRFKVINDTKGHSTGDLLLKDVADRIRNTVKSDGLVSRQGGDEFLILLEGMKKDEIEKIAQQIIDDFSRPFFVHCEEVFVTASIGISLYPYDGKDQETLIKNADTAMYLAKERGKNNYQYYNEGLNTQSTRKMVLEVGLRKALDTNQFNMVYQPQFELETGTIIGVEALIRWEHPKLGSISPVEFIPIAEETGLIIQIGKWILQQVCKDHNQWKQHGHGSIKMAVNISVRQMQAQEFVSSVKQVLEEYNVDPNMFELEITESIMQNINHSIVILKELKQLGVKIAIDDFGKGYSSLSYLKHLPIDKIKVDKSFVDDILDPIHNGSIAKAIIDMGHIMNFTVIAEGIEEKKQVDFLLKNNCKLGQGFFFRKPLPEHEIRKLLS